MKAGRREQVRQVALPSAGNVGLIARTRVKVLHCLPERSEGAGTASVIPHAGGD